MKLELNIPVDFFVSSKESNHFESVSERTAKIFLSQILNVKKLRRGNEKDKEPDYVSSAEGYEVTFSINEALIPQLRGRKPLLSNPQNIEGGGLFPPKTPKVHYENRHITKDCSKVMCLFCLFNQKLNFFLAV